MNKKKPTIVDIANELGISPSAVSKAFNDHPRISAQTKKDVERVAKKLGYQRNVIATGLRKGKSGLIGVLVPWVNLNFFSTVIKGIEDVLGEAGYHVLIGQSKDNNIKEVNQVNAFLNAQVEGIIASISSTTKEYTHFENAVNTGTKVVLFDRTIPGIEVDQVIIDDYQGACQATNHLIEQGYKRIGLISGPQHLLPYKNRLHGYQDALSKHGIALDNDIVLESSISIDEGRELTFKMLDLKKSPDAIFCLSDLFALGALDAIKQRGLNIPKQIGIMGFSNEDFTTYVSPPISSVDQFSEQMGNIAARSLLEQLEEGKKSANYRFIARKHVLSPKILVRGSSLKKDKQV